MQLAFAIQVGDDIGEHPPSAAEVIGLDLNHPSSAADLAQIDEAFAQYSVLVFRNQDITDDQQVAFSEQFGTIEHAVGSNVTTSPAMDTGTFPAGSVIILTVLDNGYITGRGGRGGTGAPITGGTPASPTYGTITTAEDGGDGDGAPRYS